MDPLQELVEAKRKEDPERYTYRKIADRGGLPLSTVYSIAKRPAEHRYTRPGTLECLAAGLEVPHERVLAAAKEAAGLTITDVSTRATAEERRIEAIAVTLGKLSPRDLRRVQRLVRDFVEPDE